MVGSGQGAETKAVAGLATIDHVEKNVEWNVQSSLDFDVDWWEKDVATEVGYRFSNSSRPPDRNTVEGIAVFPALYWNTKRKHQILNTSA